MFCQAKQNSAVPDHRLTYFITLIHKLKIFKGISEGHWNEPGTCTQAFSERNRPNSRRLICLMCYYEMQKGRYSL